MYAHRGIIQGCLRLPGPEVTRSPGAQSAQTATRVGAASELRPLGNGNVQEDVLGRPKHEQMDTGGVYEEEASAALTVCVIEDDAATREALGMLLEDAGYRVLEAANGQAGYALLRASKTRLIALIDHKMPVMDGCDLLSLVEQDEELRARHIFLMVTASPNRAEEDCGETLQELDVPLVAKPFQIDEVLDAVADAAQRLAQPVSIAPPVQPPSAQE